MIALTWYLLWICSYKSFYIAAAKKLMNEVSFLPEGR